MVMLEQIMAIDPKAAEVVATLRASVDGMHTQQFPAKPGHQGLLVSRLNTALGLTAKDDSQPRHVFIEAALGVEGGSSKGLTMAQCNATLWWLDQGGAGWVQHIVQAALVAAGQAVLPDPVVEEALRMGAEVRPANNRTERGKAMSEHWIDGNGAERKFWGYVTEMGLTPKDVYEALGVDSLRASAQTKEQIVEALKARAETKQAELLAGLKPREAVHSEARVVAWADLFTPGGMMVNVTAREGATRDDIVTTALALANAAGTLRQLGWTDVPKATRRAVAGGNGKDKGAAPVQKTTTPTPPTMPAPTAPIPRAAPAPAPAPSAQQAPVGSNGNVIQIDTLKVTAPAGKPQVEFWRTGRKYAELKWALGGEALLKLAPVLAQAGWQAEHFDAIGSTHAVNWRVSWIPSPKNPKWKDITSVEVVA